MRKRNIGDDEDPEPTRKKSKRLKYEVLENWCMGDESMEEQEFDEKKDKNGRRHQRKIVEVMVLGTNRDSWMTAQE